MAESHMTPIDSGLGSIYSMALSTVTQASVSGNQVNSKGAPDAKLSGTPPETKENSSCPLDITAEPPKDINLFQTEMVSMETQTSPTAEVCPSLFVKSANAGQEGSGSGQEGGDSGQEVGRSLPSDPDERDDQLESKDSTESDRENKTDSKGDDKEKSTTPELSLSSSLANQVKEDITSVSNKNPGNSPDVEKAAELSGGNEEQMTPNKAPSPVLVTVSSLEDDEDKTVSISESLR